MIYQATTAIAKEFQARSLHYSVEETENFSYVEIGFSGEVAKSVTARFISSDQDNDVALRVFRFVTVPEDKKAQVLLALNEIHGKFRFFKFVLDDDNTVTVSNDFAQEGGNVGKVAMEMLSRLLDVLDKAYPILMKAMWS